MATMNYQLVFLVSLTLCIAQPSFQTIEDPVANEMEDSEYFHENKTHTAGNSKTSEHFREKENHTSGINDDRQHLREKENHSAGKTDMTEPVLQNDTVGTVGFSAVAQQKTGSFTAGNTACRSGHQCGYHGYPYNWCYVDFHDRWDYCCTGSCSFSHGRDYMRCTSGNTWQYCGDAGKFDIQKRGCLADYPCGMHQERGKESFYWCFVDVQRNWDRCCQPWHKCGYHGSDVTWCFTGFKNETDWKYCTP